MVDLDILSYGQINDDGSSASNQVGSSLEMQKETHLTSFAADQ